MEKIPVKEDLVGDINRDGLVVGGDGEDRVGAKNQETVNKDNRLIEVQLGIGQVETSWKGNVEVETRSRRS